MSIGPLQLRSPLSVNDYASPHCTRKNVLANAAGQGWIKCATSQSISDLIQSRNLQDGGGHPDLLHAEPSLLAQPLCVQHLPLPFRKVCYDGAPAAGELTMPCMRLVEVIFCGTRYSQAGQALILMNRQ